MKYSFDVKISEHIWEDTLGQLICLDAIIAREGYQEYYEDDIYRNGSFSVWVFNIGCLIQNDIEEWDS